MKKFRNNSDDASTLQVTLSTCLISVSAILLAIATPANMEKAPWQDLYRRQLAERADADSISALDNYPDTSVPLSGDTTVTPDTAPANTTSIHVSTDTNFNGTFAASPTTGVVTVTDAHPAGNYTVLVTAFGPGGTTTKSFALTVAGMRCGSNLTAGFASTTDVGTGVAPYSVAIGDFNGDGRQDLAVANYNSNAVSIRLGDGLGGFSGSTEVNAGPGSRSVAIGDFNGDGKQDLAVANYDLPTVSIRRGDGLGGFSGSTEVSVGSSSRSVAIGDFNGDRKQDLAVVNQGSKTVSIRLGDGLGGFSGSMELSVGLDPRSIAIGDFNGDGKQDLAITNFNSTTVSIRLGDGLGGFSDSTEISVDLVPQSVAIGDFNGDGKQDLAITNFDAKVSIRLGDGLGSFSGSTEINVGFVPQSVAIGDFNGDGKQDLAVANSGSTTVSIRLGNGLGSFSGSTEISVGSNPYSVAIGDFNGDGKQDLAVANSSSNTVSIRLGQCVPRPCPPVITQSSSQGVPFTQEPCRYGQTAFFGQTDNSYWRAFNMGAFVGGAQYDVSSVSFGVRDVNRTQPVTVRLYRNTGAPFPGGSRTLIGSSTITVTPQQGGSVVTTPLMATVPAGTPELVMELYAPDSTHFNPLGNVFHVGANGESTTGPSYWSGVDFGTSCSATPHVIGINLVFNVYGSCTPASPTPTPPPTPTPCPLFNATGTVGQCTTAGPSGIALADVTITRTISGGAGGGSTTTDENGNYVLSGFSCVTNTFTPSKAARLPGSSGIDTADVLAVQRHFLAISLLTGCRLAAADCSSPVGISTTDVIAIQRFFLGRTTGIGNVGSYSFTPASRSYPPLSGNQTGQNYDAIVFGDVASPFAAP